MLALPLLVSLVAPMQVADAALAKADEVQIVDASQSHAAAGGEDAQVVRSARVSGPSTDVGRPAAQDDRAGAPFAPAAPDAELVPWTSRGLLDVVPRETASLLHKRSDAGSARLDRELAEVAQAVCDARLDGFVLDTLETAGAPPELVTELRGYRNLVATLGGAIPWGDLLGHEFVWAESTGAAFGSSDGMPALLLACRPGTARVEQAERSLAMLLAALTAASPIHARLDIEELRDEDGTSTRTYALRVPLDRQVTLLQCAAREDTLLLGLGERYFGDALALLRGGALPRLLATRRFQESVAGLPDDATALHWIDVRRQVDTLDDVVALVADRAFAAGLLQSTLNDALELYRHVETVATAARCAGDELVLETVTRFDPESTRQNPWYQAGLAKAASPELLDYVPADAVAFEMRGEVDVLPVWRAMIGAAEERYDWAGPVLMGARVLGAAADFGLERDVLSWLGSEHLAVTIPSRARHAGPTDTETVTLWHVADPAGVRKCLERMQAVWQVLVPPLMSDLEEALTNAKSPFVPDVTLGEAGGMYAMLRKLEVSGLPFPVPPLYFGVLGDTFVLTPSQEALDSCLAAASFMEPGLDERPLAADLVGRDDLTGARLDPWGRNLEEAVHGIGMLHNFAVSALRSAVDGGEYAWTAHSLDDLLGRVTRVLESVDFLDESVSWSERRERGLVQYECTRVALREAKAPAAKPASDPLVTR